MTRRERGVASPSIRLVSMPLDVAGIGGKLPLEQYIPALPVAKGACMARRVIEASHVIAYQDGGHRHLRDGVVVTEDDRIVHPATAHRRPT